MEPIYFQKKGYEQYKFLSNFAPSPIKMECPWWTHDGEVHEFPTVEHYYQACKAAKEEDYFRIKDVATARESKTLGSQVEMTPMWELHSQGDQLLFKEQVMLRALYAKFRQNPELKQQLLATAPRLLVEYTTWGDTYWGVDESLRGRNMLGTMLMLVRSSLAGQYR